MKIRTQDKKHIDDLFRGLEEAPTGYGIITAKIAKRFMLKSDKQEMYIKLYNYIFNKFEKINKI